MSEKTLLELAAIWFEHADAGMRGAEQVAWHYLMQALMKELQP